MAAPTVYIHGLDLGKQHDPPALATLARYQRARPNDYPEWAYTVVGLRKFPLGTPYLTQPERPDERGLVEQVRDLLNAQPAFAGSMLAVDWTGVGIGVVDMLRALRPPLNLWIRPIQIASGAKVTVEEGGGFTVPKAELVTNLEVLLQANRLTISPAPAGDAVRAALLEELADEFRVFSRKVTKKGNEKTGAAGDKHDDMVLAVSLAAWLGEHAPVGWDGSLGLGGAAPTPPRSVFAQAPAAEKRDYPSADPYAGQPWFSADGFDKREPGAGWGNVDPGSGIPSQW